MTLRALHAPRGGHAHAVLMQMQDIQLACTVRCINCQFALYWNRQFALQHFGELAEYDRDNCYPLRLRVSRCWYSCTALHMKAKFLYKSGALPRTRSGLVNLKTCVNKLITRCSDTARSAVVSSSPALFLRIHRRLHVSRISPLCILHSRRETPTSAVH